MKKPYRSIWYEPDSDQVCIIDQTRLPHQFAICRLTTLEDACEAIRSMQVRGAPLIGVTAAFGIYLALRDDPASLERALKQLLATRPTAVNLRWALNRVASDLSEQAPSEAADKALQLALDLAEEDIACCDAIAAHGSELLRLIWQRKADSGRPLEVLTHCNTGALAAAGKGTALAVIFQAAEQGIPVHVWVDETRPRNQGAALTCWELRQRGIDHSLIVDSAAGHVMGQGKVDVCLTGADRVSAAGDVCNKIGTYQVALAARDNSVPFYAALPVSTFDFSWPSAATPIAIEERDAAEISDQNHGTPMRNFAFDITPSRLVGGIITERGVFRADQESLKVLDDAAVDRE